MILDREQRKISLERGDRDEAKKLLEMISCITWNGSTKILTAVFKKGLEETITRHAVWKLADIPRERVFSTNLTIHR